MKKIIVIKGKSQYDALRMFADQVVHFMQNKGVEVDILDLNEENAKIINVLSRHVGTKVDAVFSFNAVGIDLNVNNMPVSDLLNTKFYAFLVDHPMIHIERIRHLVKELVVSVIDYNHARYIRKHIDNVSEVYMISHGGMMSDNIKAYVDRNIDVLFTGTYIDPKSILMCFDNLADSAKNVALGVIKTMLNDSTLSEEEAMICLFKNYGLDELLDSVPKWMENLPEIDMYVRAYRRDALIRSLVEAGIKVNVYGNGWDKFKCEQQENLVIGPAIDYIKSLELMGDSKIVLNIMPEFKRGSHERVFCAMLNKAVCLTDRSSYNVAHFEDGKDIVFYDVDNLQELPNIVKDLLNNPDRAMQIAENGYVNASKYHTWENRVTQILETLE
ncbi:MAG: glycosyltransferase family 1 protein [Lachnospira sp.]|nr:glycosyltransferase family 1 protein [Lachnospira sp.]